MWRGIKDSYNLTDLALSFMFLGFPKCICYLLLKDTIINQRHKPLNHAIVLTDNRRTLIAREVIASSFLASKIIASAWPHHAWFSFRIILPLVFQ